MLQFKDIDSIQKDGKAKGAIHTASEIAGQPELWLQVFNTVFEKRQDLEQFLFPILKVKDLRIILTGAGSSAFIGESIQGIVQFESQRNTQAIPTTDLITHPGLFFLKEVPTLLISFARSGNSPESLEAVNLANIYCDTISHLIITCNKSGKLIQNANNGNYYTFLLPESANDQSLAMTGSFTSMLLSILLIAKLKKIDVLLPALHEIVSNARQLIGEYLPFIKRITRKRYERVIFLGSGPLLGIARECHLKLQELTDGQVICKHDSFLGFRHGPRVVSNERSLIVYLFSNNDHVFKYERDLAKSIDSDNRNLPTISYGRKVSELQNSILDIEFSNSNPDLNDINIISAALIGQLLGFYYSIELGLQPDSPSVSGAINRVVEGVTIYSEIA